MPQVPPQFDKTGRRVVHVPKGREDRETRALRRGDLASSYDADQTTPENRRHWAPARDVPISSLNNRATRQRLRVRARYETDNNTYCRGMVSTVGTDVIGSSMPQLQVLTKDNGFNSYVEEEWKRWAESFEVNLPSKLHLLDECRRVEGEGFFLTFTDEEAGAKLGHSLNFNVISPRRVINPEFAGVGINPSTGRYYDDDGLLVDTKTGRPKSVRISAESEDLISLTQSKVDPVSARYCYQWFGPTRPSQYRGVCEIQAALPMFAYIRRYELATVSTAEIIAAMTAFMKTQSAPLEGPAKVADFSEREIVRGMLMSLPDGWEPYTLDAKQPPATFEMFLNMMLRGIGRVLNMPFGVIAGDHSKYNFASGRLDYRLYDDRLTKDRTQLNIRVLNPAHGEWLAEFARTDPRVARAIERGEYYHTWKYQRRPSISPKEDAETENVRLRNGTTTYAEVYADRAGDWEESFEQRAKETEKIKSLGLDTIIDTGNGGSPPAQPAAAGDTEE